MGNIGGMEQGKSQYEQQHDIYLSYGKRIAELEAKKSEDGRYTITLVI